MEFMDSDRNERAVDTQWPSFSAQGAGVRALEIPEHAVSIGDEIGGHLDPMSDRRILIQSATHQRGFLEMGDLPLIVDLADA